MSSVIRSFSFPAEDLDDLADLAEDHGGWSQLFQDLYRPLLAHRAAYGRDPEPETFAAAVSKEKAAREAQKEALSRMRREKHEARARRHEERLEERLRKKRSAFPTAEQLGEAHAYATTQKLTELAQEYAYDVEHVLKAAAARRARDEAEAEARIKPKPSTFEGWIEYALPAFTMYEYDRALQAVERVARENHLDRAKFVMAVRERWKGQQNLHATIAPAPERDAA